MINDQSKIPDYLFADLKDINPFEEKDVYFTLKTNEDLGNKKIKFVLQKMTKIFY